ncbi:HAD family hydrolase [Agromyces sp. ZXT2-6]|uniref:HAD family hydrolase n=1 Tax=Agromyces sp. ZXT2-6 TaxID=3461153 RepID=UPI00405533BA
MITLAVLGFEGTTIRRASTDAAAVPRTPEPLRGAEATLAELRRRGVRVALVCDPPRSTAEPMLATLGWTVAATPGGIGVVDALVCADEIAALPPAPYAVHHAMELTGTLDVRQVLVAGDTLALLEAGRAAGAGWVVGVLTGPARRPELESGPHDAVLSTVNDLLALAVPAAPSR